MPRRRAVVIVGKAPRPGQAKTRLVPPLSYDAAAQLSGAFLRDTAELALSLHWECVTVVHPAQADEAERLTRLLPPDVRCRAQAGHGLGDALRTAFASHFEDAFERVVLVDSDSPTLPKEILEEAERVLEHHQVSIGPSRDGGYYLLALRQPEPRLFDDIAWSTSRVLEQTVERARAASLSMAILPEWYDVDEAPDLARLQADLRTQPQTVAVHTRHVLERLAQLIA